MMRGHFEEEGVRHSALVLRRVDEILAEIRAVSLAHLSRHSPEGFERRLQAFGESLRQLIVAIGAVTSGAGKAQELSARLDETIECAHVALEHRQASHAAERGVGLAMAVRLARRLVEAPLHEATSFAEAANAYARRRLR
ncbi:MAG: hypothetical protein M3430_16485 [Acidobacteriota bacterium]|nr:hypothetical protein [Acidobacteriota bacterium]